MMTTSCLCGETLYFENTGCSTCGRVVGWCDACNSLSALNFDTGDLTCGCCGAELVECPNRAQHQVCNGMVSPSLDGAGLCRRCRVTTLVPDTSDPQSVARWRVLEAGKRRLLYGLDRIGLDEAWREDSPPLRFRFAADTPGAPVETGHADGVITINLKEADPVAREVSRQEFGEPQRTVIGHLRHEFGHYLQLRLFGDQPAEDITDLFGDPSEVLYNEAVARHYEQGPPADWRESHISAYATMHPWEDFAETASFYLDMRAVLDTLVHHGVIVKAYPETFDETLGAYQAAALTLNEVNRTMGLTDLAPYVVPGPVVDKLRRIDRAVREVTSAPEAAATAAAG